MIYFDNAATSFPKPRCVIKAVNACIKKFGGNPGRGGHALSLLASEIVYSAREEVAALLYARPEQIVFTPNATFALNLAIQTRLKAGSHVLISDQEHNATFRVVHALAEKGLVTYDFFPSKEFCSAEIEKRIRPNTDTLICNLTSNLTGNTLSLSTLLSVARQHKLYLILDASQWIGHQVICREIAQADAICAPGHKGLYGIQGSGFLYLKKGDALSPFVFGGSGTDSESPNMPSYIPERFEAGTLSTPAIASLAAGIRYIRAIGLEEIEAHEKALTHRCIDILSDFPSVSVYTSVNGGTSLVSFSHPDFSSEELADRIDQYGICVRGGFHCAPIAHRSQIGTPGGAVRISFGLMNRLKELDALYTALSEILK